MAKILLVEDDLDLALIVTDSLSAEQHVIEHAATGPAARDRLIADTHCKGFASPGSKCC